MIMSGCADAEKQHVNGKPQSIDRQSNNKKNNQLNLPCCHLVSLIDIIKSPIVSLISYYLFS